MAVALAKGGRSVTLIDCDIDCPNLHLLLGAGLENRQEVHSFLPRVDPEACTRCGRCTGVCRENALYMPKSGTPKLFPSICSGCEACRLACPTGAISEGKKRVGWTYQIQTKGINLITGELEPSEPLSAAVLSEAAHTVML